MHNSLLIYTEYTRKIHKVKLLFHFTEGPKLGMLFFIFYIITMLTRFSFITILLFVLLACPLLFLQADNTTHSTTINYLPGPMILTEDIIDKNPETTVISVDFKGLQRVSPNTLKAVIDIHSGTSLGSIDLSEVQLRLLRTDLFVSVQFYYQPKQEGYALIIKVEERPYIELIPYFSLTRGAVITGGATINSKVRGNDALVLGSTVWQRGGITGKLGYVNPELYDGNGIFTMFFSGGHDTRSQSYTDGTEFRSFSGYTGNIVAKLQFNQNRTFQPGFRLEYEMLDLSSSWDPKDNLPDSSEMLGAGIDVSYDTTYYIYYFREGSQINLDLSRGFVIGPREGDLYGSIEAQKTVQVLSRNIISLYAASGFNFTSPLHYNELNGAGFRVLPIEKTVDRLYLTGAAEYEIPIAQPSFGTLTGFCFVESGLYSPLEDIYEFFLGPGLGFRFYVQRVETPVLGFNAGLNTANLEIQAEFFFGIQF